MTSLTDLEQAPLPGRSHRWLGVMLRHNDVAHSTSAALAPAARPAATTGSSSRRRRAWLRGVRPLSDACVAAACSGTAAALDALPTVTTLLIPGIWVAMLVVSGSYDPHLLLASRSERMGRVITAGARLGLGCWVLATLGGIDASSQHLLGLTVALTGLTLIIRELSIALAAGWSPATRILIAGDAEQVRRTMTELCRVPHPTFDVAAVCVLDPGQEGSFEVPVGRGFAELVPTATSSAVDAVVVLPHDQLHSRVLQRLGWELEQTSTQLFVGTGLLDVARSRTTVTDAGGVRMLHVRPSNHRGASRMVKELCERVIAVLALVLLTPALITVAVVVRRDSGPAIYRQERVGRDGKPFTMFKYRTMHVGAHQQVMALADQSDGNDVLFKLRTDPRITTAGAWLRRYSIDELPQLINVARGEMSLVGPRPALPREVALYDHDPRRRLAVKPGLTGLWQVSGRSDLSWDETVRLDLLYVDNWSLGLDLSILLRTARAVLSHRGAY